jgi:hypothetical protein
MIRLFVGAKRARSLWKKVLSLIDLLHFKKMGQT